MQLVFSIILDLMLIFSLAAPVQAWDHHVKDGFRRKEEQGNNSNGGNSAKWDGSRRTNVVSHLERFSTNKGYGAKGLYV